MRDYIFGDYSRNHFFNIQSHIHFINSFNTQIGNVYRMINKPYKYELIPDSILRNPLDVPGSYRNTYYFRYGFDQHTIDGMIDYLAKDGVITADTNPVGLKNGYIEYLNPQRNQLYWHQYFQCGWNYMNDHGIRHQEKKFDEFYNNGVKALEAIRRKHYRKTPFAPIPKSPLLCRNGLFGNAHMEMHLPELKEESQQQPIEQSHAYQHGNDGELPAYIIEPSAPPYESVEQDMLPAEYYDYSDAVRHGKMQYSFFKGNYIDVDEEIRKSNQILKNIDTYSGPRF